MPLAEQTLEMTVKRLGHDHPAVVPAVTQVAHAHWLAGELLEARSLYALALSLAEKLLEENDPFVGALLSQFGRLQVRLGDLPTARKNLERALVIQGIAYGKGSSELAGTLLGLGRLSMGTGDWSGALELLQQSLALLERDYGRDHPYSAVVIGDIAMVLLEIGRFTEARRLADEALLVNMRKLGLSHAQVAWDLNGVGRVLYAMGDLVGARGRFEHALAIQEKALPTGHPDLAVTLGNLGVVLNELGFSTTAETLLTRALNIETKVQGEEHPGVACTLTNLWEVYRVQGKTWEAQQLSRRAVAISGGGPQGDPRAPGAAMNRLACDSLVSEESERALLHFQRSLELAERSLGPEHPDVVRALINMATTYDALGNPEVALRFTERALDLEERALKTMTAFGSLAEVELFINRMAWNSSWAVSLQAASEQIRYPAVLLGLTTVLRRKGRALDTRAPPRSATDDPELAELAAGLLLTRQSLAFLDLHSSETHSENGVSERCLLSDRLRLLSSELRRVQARLGVPSAEVTISAVQERLPPRSVLIEFYQLQPVLTRSVEDREWNPAPRYLAYLLHPQGSPNWVDLGEAEAIDRRIDAFRASLTGQRWDVREQARRLDELTMAPLRPLLGKVDSVLISPDGALNLVPFGALVDEEGSYLVEHYQLSYLSSGRDLLLDQVAPSREPPLIVGASGFDPSLLGLPAGKDLAAISPAITDRFFAPLPGVAEEVRQIGEILELAPQRVLIGDAVREKRVKEAHGPQILHLAAHGAFRGEANPARQGPTVCLEVEPDLDPLPRSFVAFRPVPPGAATAAEDGILTAMEMLDLDLDGAEVVVLSACETGVGEVRPGSGIFGLRRALVLAGARTQVLSLWRVEDKATSALMTSWYRRLKKGQPRGEALRRAQLAMARGEPLVTVAGGLGSGEDSVLHRGAKAVEPIGTEVGDRLAGYRHPYFWAGFILVGDTGPLLSRPWSENVK